jgi:hypothetical protein
VPYGTIVSPNWQRIVVLDGDHGRLLQAVLPVCAEYGLALAGGYAIKAHGLVDRPSDDIDLATAANAPVAEIMTALAGAYRDCGYEVQVLDIDARKGHLLVTLPLGGTYRVDVLKEPLNHPFAMMESGPVIGLADAVALKMSALHDRVMPRDLLDVHGASAHFSGPELISLCRAAMDEEFSLETLRDQLNFGANYPDSSFERYGCTPEKIGEVRAWALRWAMEIGLDIAEAEPWADPDDCAAGEYADD